MTLRDYLGIAKRWWWLVVVGCALAGGSAYLVTSRMTPVYSATAVVLVNQKQDPGTVTYQDVLGSKSLTKTYAQLATSNINLQRALDALKDSSVNLEKLGNKVSASAVIDTQLIEITAEDPNGARAAVFANAVADALPGYIHDAQVGGASDGVVANTIFIAERATAPQSPVRPNKSLNTVLGAILGLIVMVGAVALIEYFDDDINSGEDVKALGLPYLGSVIRVAAPRGIANRASWVPNILSGEVPAMAESYRRLQANLSFSLKATGASVLVVTSAAPGEGKTTTAANLAVVLAESTRRVLLIDGDLRKPSLHRFFSFPNAAGLSAAFLSRSDEPPFAARIADTLALMTTGALPPNPVEMLASKRMAALMKYLTEEFDTIVVDTAPILAVADTTMWLALAKGVVLVAREDKTRRGALAAAATAVKASGVPVLGVVVNRANPKRSESYYYNYYGDSTPERAGHH